MSTRQGWKKLPVPCHPDILDIIWHKPIPNTKTQYLLLHALVPFYKTWSVCPRYPAIYFRIITFNQYLKKYIQIIFNVLCSHPSQSVVLIRLDIKVLNVEQSVSKASLHCFLHVNNLKLWNLCYLTLLDLSTAYQHWDPRL